jgi:Trk-type K+ transport system membrane component
MDKSVVEQVLPLTRRAAVPVMVMWLVCAYLLIMPIAEAALRWDFEITRDRSRFAVINAITLTGFQASVGVDGYPTSGKVAVLMLTLIGAVFSMIVGGMAVVRILRLPYTDRQVVASAIRVCAIFPLVGAIPLIEGGHSPFDALMLSASALGNSGLAFGELPGVLSWQTHLVLLPLSILGGLGLPVLMELSDVIRQRRELSTHGRTVLTMTAGLYLAVFVACFMVQWLSDDGEALVNMVGISSAAAVNSRTTGFGFQFAQAFPRGMQWILLLAMAIGGSPAGTAGGLKTTTLVELFRGVRKALTGHNPGRPFGIAAAWVGAYVLMVAAVMLLLLQTVPQLGADRLLYEAVSALSNVGLSHGTIMVVGPGLDVLSGAMLLGRLAPLGILWWMTQTTEDAELAIG